MASFMRWLRLPADALGDTAALASSCAGAKIGRLLDGDGKGGGAGGAAPMLLSERTSLRERLRELHDAFGAARGLVGALERDADYWRLWTAPTLEVVRGDESHNDMVS